MLHIHILVHQILYRTEIIFENLTNRRLQNKIRNTLLTLRGVNTVNSVYNGTAYNYILDVAVKTPATVRFCEDLIEKTPQGKRV